jgi:general stress protein YciG
MIGKVATGEIEDEREELSSAAAQLGSKGGKARAESMSPERWAEIARKAAEKRWSSKQT